MFDDVISKLKTIFLGLWQWMGNNIGVVAGVCGAVFGLSGTVISFINSCVNWSCEAIGVTSATGSIGSLVSVAQTWIPVVNTFVPLAETVSMGVGYGVMWVGWTSYRFAKSWIPSVA